MDSELFKNRSVGSCLSDAFELFRTNFKTLFRRLWLSAVVLSLLLAVAMVYSVQYPNGADNVILNLGALVDYILIIAAFVWFYTIIMSLLNGRSVKANLPRLTRLTFLLIGIVIVICVVLIAGAALNYAGVKNPSQFQGANIQLVLGMLACMLVFFVALLPLNFSAMKYCMEEDKKVFSIFQKPYVMGLRHWGYIFLTALLTGIIDMVISIIVLLPFYVIMLCNMVNRNGMAFGDPSGLSGGFLFLAFVTATLCSFVGLFIRPWIVFSYYYAYGSIEEKEKGRQERKDMIVSEEQSTDIEEVK